MDSTSRPSSRASVRSEAPLPPPKPLHLTLSLRQGGPRVRPGMPRWSGMGSVFGDGHGGSVEESEDEGDDDADAGGGTLHAPSGERRGEASGFSLGVGSLREGGGSTLRPAGAAKTKGTRLSVLFNTTIDNPLAGGNTIKQDAQLSAALSPVSPRSTTAGAADPGDASERATNDDGGEDAGRAGADQTVLDITELAQRAISTHAFEGEAAFGELSFGKGQELEIEVADLGGNWSLGWVVKDGEAGRGLIPIGYYKLVDGKVAGSATALVSPPATSSTTPTQPTSTPSLSPPTPQPGPTEPSASHFQILNLFADDPPATPHPSTPARDPHASAYWRTALGDNLALSDNSPATPRTPNTPRSIGRKVIVSGVEFEPTGPVLDGEERGSYFPSQREVFPDATVDSTGQQDGADESSRVAEASVAPQTPPAGRQVDWTDLPTTHAVETEWIATPDRRHCHLRSPSSPPSAQKAWADSPDSKSDPHHATGSSSEEADNFVPPLAPFTLAPGARLSLTDSRALMGFRDTDVRPRQPSCEANTASEADTAEVGVASEGLLARAVETIGKGCSTLLGIERGSRSEPGTDPDRLTLEARNELEEWVLGGDDSTSGLSSLGEGPVFHIESGPAWRPAPSTFTVHVHSPTQRHSLASGDYTVFQLTTVFDLSHPSPVDPDFAHAHHQSTTESIRSTAAATTVDRRYSHFVVLHRVLRERYPVLVLPDLPGKSFRGRADVAFMESRRRDLERWLSRVGRHPVLSQAEELRAFLIEEEEGEVERMLRGEGSGGGEGVGWFLGRVLHPDFNVDVEEAEEMGQRFGRHVRASEVGGGTKRVEQDVGHLRGGMRGKYLSSHYTSLGHSLARLVSGRALPPLSPDRAALGPGAEPAGSGSGSGGEEAGERNRRRAREWCLQNEQGGYSFRDDDEEGLSLAKAVQAAGEAMVDVAQVYDEQAETALLPVQELLREAAYPHSQNAALLERHHQLLALHTKLASLPLTPSSADALARLDTLLNLTAAELAHAHATRLADLRAATTALLDAHLDAHRAALAQLEFARAHFDEEGFAALAGTGPRLRSRLERGGGEGGGGRGPLVMPSGYGVPGGLLGRRMTEGMGSLLVRTASREGGGVRTGRTPAPTAGTMRQPSVAEILAAQERGELAVSD